jgi:Xaa-Pro aminopeptidase
VTTHFRNRIDKLKEELAGSLLDGFLITGLSNVRYFSGFDGFFGALLITHYHSILLTDFTHYQAALESIPALRVRCLTTPLMCEIGQLTLRMSIKRLGFDPRLLTYNEYRELKRQHSKLKLISKPEVISRQRSVKSIDEVKLLRQSAETAVQSFQSIIQNIRPGRSEKSIAIDLDMEIRKGSADGCAFNTIVLSGKRTQYPHARPSLQKVQKGDLILIDFGAQFRGYHSDCTRMLVIGKPSTRQKELHKVVFSALEAALETVKPGNRFKKVDYAAREVINRAGYGSFFQHALGHGTGLDLHEDPIIDNTNERMIEPNMVMTLEPGIFIPEWGGIRIEEMVRVTEGGPELLTNLERSKLFEIN